METRSLKGGWALLASADLEANRFVQGLRRTTWEDANGDAVTDDDTFHTLSASLGRMADSLTPADSDASEALNMLADVCSMHLVENDWNTPYVPWLVSGGRRTLTPDDLSEEALQALYFVSTTNAAAHLRARAADVCWLRSNPRNRGFQHAMRALEIWESQGIVEDRWYRDGRAILHRALDLCAHLRRRDSQSVFAAQILEAARASESPGLCLQLCEVANRYGLLRDHAEELAVLLEAHAKSSSSELGLRRNLLLGAVPWHQQLSNEAEVVRVQEEAAGTWLEEAEERGPKHGGSHLVAASLLESALQQFQTIPRRHRSAFVDEQLAQLPRRIREMGAGGLDEMATFTSDPIDISGSVRASRRAVRNKRAMDALVSLANLVQLTNFDETLASAKQADADSVFSSMLGFSTYESDGRKVGVSAGSGGKVIFGLDPALWRLMIQTYEIDISIRVQGAIWPALQVVMTQHQLRIDDFRAIVRGAGFVPPQQHEFVAQGLYAGYRGSFVLSTHVLPPQIEAVVRYHLQEAGVNTSRITGEASIDMETGLSTLMEAPQAVEIFGPDLAFEFRALLCGPLGPNLRNRVAHGLVSASAAGGVEGVYLWWLVLRLTFNAFFNASRET
jgi:hypothetical protein